MFIFLSRDSGAPIFEEDAGLVLSFKEEQLEPFTKLVLSLSCVGQLHFFIFIHRESIDTFLVFPWPS